MALIRVGALPAAPLAAAAAFHARVLPGIEALLDRPRDAEELLEPLILIFPPADYTHGGWRLAVVQALARAAAPRRINALVAAGDARDDAAMLAAVAYLDDAPGVTGQLFVLDGTGAGTVLS